MFITGLSVESIGCFPSAAHVHGFGQGVNVLAAGNELGKSTLFRAIRTCLFCRHDSKTSGHQVFSGLMTANCLQPSNLPSCGTGEPTSSRNPSCARRPPP